MKKDPTGLDERARTQMKRMGVNFSTSRELLELAQAHRPALAFTARTLAEWRTWRRRFLVQLHRALGPDLPKAPPEPRLVETLDAGDHWRHKLVYRTTARMWAPAYLLVPKALFRARAGAPAVLAIHGHGRGGGDLVGLTTEQKPGDNPNHNYALEVVRRGMIAFVPELRGFGQRSVDEDQLARINRERGVPEEAALRRDMCNVQDLKANLLGYTFMRLQLHDLSAALDVLEARPEVNPARIGACGLSTGGMMTLFLAALDRRIQAAIISGTLTSYRSYAFQIETTCGSQLPHGLFRWGDLAEVGCLLAPRPVCFESGARDHGFLADVARGEFRRVKRCYEMAGVPERALFDAFPGGHEWHGAVGLPMLEAWLKR